MMPYAISLPDGCNLLRLQRRANVKRRLFLLALGSLMAATAAYAHHSFARDYHEDQMISLEGDVVSFDYRNPHAWVYFTANDNGGVPRKFGAEWANPRRLEQQGIGASVLKAGDHVIVRGAPSRSATTYNVHLKSIHRPADGWSWPGGRGRTR
jgi:Family of unknown function (DUF6152)